MPYIKCFLIPLLLLTALGVAQDDFNTFGESSIALDHKVSKGYTANFSLKSRYFLYRDHTVQFTNQQIDITHFSTCNLNIFHAISFGLLYRNRDWFDMGSEELRITEQYNFKKQKMGVRYGHRFRLEQRFIDKQVISRLRYRFAVDFPLNGEKLDIGEAYLVSSIEGLLSLSKINRPQTDLRIASQIGWQLSEALKLQTGIEHRIEAFNLVAKNNLYLLTSAIIKI